MMDSQAHDSYLESQVLTATPQKLRLMLVEGAMGAARQALSYWEESEDELASASLSRCRNILSELLAGINPDSTALTKRVAGVYVFLFKLVTDAQLNRNVEAIQKTLEILSVEQETWRMVCDKMPHAPLPATGGGGRREITAAEATQVLAAEGQLPRGGFTIDA